MPDRIEYLEDEAVYYLHQIKATADYVLQTLGTDNPDFGSAENLGLHASKAAAMVRAAYEIRRKKFTEGE